MSTTIASTKKYEDMSARENIAASPTESPRDRGRRPERKFSALTETPTKAAAANESRPQGQSGSRTRERQYSFRDNHRSSKVDEGRDSNRRYADERESKSRDRDRSRERK